VRPSARRLRPSGLPRGLTEQARADWAALAQPTATPEPFGPTAVAGLPEPVRRSLIHAITSARRFERPLSYACTARSAWGRGDRSPPYSAKGPVASCGRRPPCRSTDNVAGAGHM
jgi:hypothetical protein